MSGGVMGGASGVSIPSGVKKTIENIKESPGQNHSEDQIYTMLKECSMDPDETTQKLRLLDTVHEVKRKCDSRKENVNKEPAEKWKRGTQVQTNRVGRGNYSSWHISQDAGGGGNLPAIKETSQLTEKCTSKGPLALPKICNRMNLLLLEGATGLSTPPNNQCFLKVVVFCPCSPISALSNGPSAIDSIKNPSVLESKDVQQHQTLELSNNAAPIPSPPASGS